MTDLDLLIDEARGLAMLICPMAFQLEDGAEIDRMPDDLFRAANMLGRLCDELLRAVRPGEESGWVIERADSEPSRPMYFTGKNWDYDNLKAVRFARKEDAQKMARYMFPGEPHRIADHMWCP